MTDNVIDSPQNPDDKALQHPSELNKKEKENPPQNPAWRISLNDWRVRYALLVMALVVFWSGSLDKVALDLIDGAFVNAGIIYGVGRGINALVSMIQSAEISVVLVTVSVGEILDPVNDLIERFSEVMTYALASLALQKVLLVITSSQVFNLLLTLLMLTMVLAHLLKQQVLTVFLFRSVLVLVWLRISFALIILMNTFVDQVFLEQQTQQHFETMSGYQAQLSSAADLISTDTQKLDASALKEIEEDMSGLKQQAAALAPQIEQQRQKVSDQRNKLLKLKLENGLTYLFSTSETIQAEQTKLTELEQTLTGLKRQSTEVAHKREQLQESIDCAEKAEKGESCSWLDWMSKASQTLNIQTKIAALNDQIAHFIESTVLLLTLILLKSILLPLLFWWLVYRVFKVIWNSPMTL